MTKESFDFMKQFYILVLALGMVLPVQAQLYSGVLASDRASSTWTTAGATYPTRTQCGSTIAAYSGSPATINSAIAACGSNQYVLLGAGAFSLNAGIDFEGSSQAGKQNVGLKGSGPLSTTVTVTTGSAAVGSCGIVAICIANNYVNYSLGPQNTANWTAHYNVGDTVITLSSVANLAIGSLIILDQLNDVNTDYANQIPFVCGGGNAFSTNYTGTGWCSTSGASAVGRDNRQQLFVTTVTGISGNDVTLADPLVHPNWISGKTPGAWWAGALGASQPATTAVWLEDMTLNLTGLSNSNFGVLFYNCYNCGMKNVRSLAPSGGLRANVRLTQTSHVSIIDSYFYNHQGATANYGIENNTTAYTLIQNNITECSTGGIVTDATVGSVYGYNYAMTWSRATSRRAPRWTTSTARWISSPCFATATSAGRTARRRKLCRS